MAASSARAQQRHRETPSRGSPEPRVSCQVGCAAGPVSVHGKDFVAEVGVPPLLSQCAHSPHPGLAVGISGHKTGSRRSGNMRSS